MAPEPRIALSSFLGFKEKYKGFESRKGLLVHLFSVYLVLSFLFKKYDYRAKMMVKG